MHDSQNQTTNVVSDYYDNYADTQKEVLAIKVLKTRNILFTLAAIFFASDLLALLIANAVTGYTILMALVLPVILIGLAFLSLKEPLSAMIIATVLIAALWVYIIYLSGVRGAVMGWLIKAVIIYFIIAGFQQAAEAHRIKKELKV